MLSIPYSHQHIDQKDVAAVAGMLRSAFLTQGPLVEKFEAALCRYTGARYAVCVSNGTAALHLACLSAGLGKGDEVIVPANTFVASANSVLYTGARPLFVDVDMATGNLDLKALDRSLTKRTKAVMGVDYAGQPCAWVKLSSWAKKHGLLLIDDASHALGASYGAGKARIKVGCSRHADMTTLSFHPLKTMTTGEGGAVLTNDQALYKKILYLRSHGIVKDRKDFVRIKGCLSAEEYASQMIDLGFNYRLTDIQCALGLSQLKKVDRFVEARTHVDGVYRSLFKDNPYFDLLEQREGRSSCHLFPVLLRDPSRRKEVVDGLRANGIGVQVHYMPVYWHPYYQSLGYARVRAPQAEEFYRREISLPIFPGMKVQDIRRVQRVLFRLLEHRRPVRGGKG